MPQGSRGPGAVIPGLGIKPFSYLKRVQPTPWLGDEPEVIFNREGHPELGGAAAQVRLRPATRSRSAFNRINPVASF
jgi:hypothetical protein